MRAMYFCASVDDVGLDGYSTPEHLENLLEFWDREGIKGTLFVVPRSDGKALTDQKAYVDLLSNALRAGHEVAQHGLDHTRFQTGIPPRMVLDLPHEGPARQYLAEHREQIEADLSVENLRNTLATGRQILESALQIAMRGFRAPCLSTCENLFRALDAEGYLYDSSCVFQTTAWDMIVRPDQAASPVPIDRQRFDAFQICRSARTLPIAAEYTWYLRRGRYDSFLNLAKHDFDACLAARVPFVPVCHVSPLQEGDRDCGFALYRDLIGHARAQCNQSGVPWVAATMTEVAEQWTSIFDGQAGREKS